MTEDFEILRDELTRALHGLDERQTQLKPAGNPAKWNIQQIVGHLLLTYAATDRAMDARLAKRAPTKAKPSIAQRAGRFGLIALGYVPRGRIAPETVTAPADSVPASSRMLISQIEAAIASMDSRVTAVEKMFGSRCMAVGHMILGPLSVGQWRRFHLVHGRHHMKQIAAIRRDHKL